MASRNLLAVNKLEDFKQWLIKNDWLIEQPKGKYEVLRARKDTEKIPLIVYKKTTENLVHLSVSDYNSKFVKEFIDSKKTTKIDELDIIDFMLKEIEGIGHYISEIIDLKDIDFRLELMQIDNRLNGFYRDAVNMLKTRGSHD